MRACARLMGGLGLTGLISSSQIRIMYLLAGGLCKSRVFQSRGREGGKNPAF